MKQMYIFLPMLLMLTGFSASAQEKPLIGNDDMRMDTAYNIVRNIYQPKDLSILAKAITAANLSDTLNGDAPFTLFAPRDKAFNNLPKGTVEALLEPANQQKLRELLAYHLLQGKYDIKKLKDAIKEKKGTARLETVNGAILTFILENGDVYILDESGNKERIRVEDLHQKNGVIHVINTVLLPKAIAE